MEKRINDKRMKHMHGVAEYMYTNAEKYGLDKNEMYVLGLLHDVGYVNGKSFHETFGADMLASMGLPLFITDAIRWHGTSPEDYLDIHMCDVESIPKQLILLWEADLHIDQSGEDIGYELRLKDIGERLGFDSEPYRVCKETAKWLQSYKLKID